MSFRRHKYNAKKTRYNGQIYDSKREAQFAYQLDLQRRAVNPKERVINVTRQFVFYIPPGAEVCKYIIDFVVLYADGHTNYYEVKGYETEVSKLKRKLMAYFYPHANIQIVK